MKLESQITARELSERRRDLGVKRLGTLYWRRQDGGPWSIATADELAGAAEFVFAPTAAELIAALPSCVNVNAFLRIEKGWVMASEVEWSVSYRKNGEIIYGFQWLPAAECSAKMLIFLLEKQIITVDEVNTGLGAA